MILKYIKLYLFIEKTYFNDGNENTKSDQNHNTSNN
jgi:hypothetical protein